MAEVIQFNCPVCATKLSLPLAMAAQRGPCPSCQREIVAPDPHRGISSHEAPLPILRKEPESLPELPPFPEIEKPPEPVPPSPVETVPAPDLTMAPMPVGKKPDRTLLLLSCLLAGAAGLAIGFALGLRSTGPVVAAPAISRPLPEPPKEEKPTVVAAPPVVEPAPAPVTEQPVAAPPEAEPLKPSVKASAAAEMSLRAFLDAPDWAARSAHVLYPEKVRDSMEAYSHEVPDGPTVFESISVKQSQIDEATGNTLFIFIVATEQFPGGIPVAIQETTGGWRVDWLAFVEFRDSLFQKFVDGPANKGGFFHLVVSVPQTETENAHFTSYLLQSPLAGKGQLAYVKKNSPAATTLAAQTSNGRTYTPVLEVVKRQTPDQQDFLEVLSVKADDWFPRGN